jgi:hypothetical protein
MQHSVTNTHQLIDPPTTPTRTSLPPASRSRTTRLSHAALPVNTLERASSGTGRLWLYDRMGAIRAWI